MIINLNEQVLNKLNKTQCRPYNGSFPSIASNKLILNLPTDYLYFMRLYNGCVGFIGAFENYIDIWTLENVLDLNPYYPDEKFCQEVIIIGSNGSGTLYGYDLKNRCFFKTDEYDMTRNSIINCGTTLLDLIINLELEVD